MTTSPIYRQGPAGRRELLRSYVGEAVELYVEGIRGGAVNVHRGTVIAVAYCKSGTTTDVVVLDRLVMPDGSPATIDGYRSLAVPGAQVAGIRLDPAFNGVERLRPAGRIPEWAGQ